jgi:hypothetical protein
MMALLPLFIQLGGAFIENKALLTSIESGIKLGVDLFDLGQKIIEDSGDAPADQLAAANALVTQLQSLRDEKEALLAAIAPNS